MRFQFIFGFIFLILALIGIFVGLPYLLQIIKSNQSFSFSFPRFIATSTPSYYYGNQSPASYSTSTSSPAAFLPKISMSVYRYGQGQISLRAPYFSGAPINITGWKIKSEKNGETIISKGVVLPQFEGASDIVLNSGELAEIIVGLSPLGGSFRVNGCLGWLSNLYNIGYALNDCPRIELGDLSELDSQCQELILQTSSCRAPDDDILNGYSSQCRKWVEQNLNYGACVAKNRSDKNFYKEWKIYTGNGNQIYDPLHDKIELRDRSGSLIDSYEY